MSKPFVSLKIFNKNDKLIQSVNTHKIKRIYYFIQKEKFKDCTFFIRVTYDSEKGYLNEGKYKTKKSLVRAFKAFTDND